MVKISVISVARAEHEFNKLRKALSTQTFKDFELITSTKGSIPKAWNDALSRAKGEIIVFTESDALPLNDNWLAEIANNVMTGVVLKGLEIRATDLDLCNLACDASILKKIRFDESFKICEDVELFARLRKMGVEIRFINAFPVIHVPSQTWRKTLSRGLRLGMNLTKVVYMHGRDNIDDINTRNYSTTRINPISNRIRIIVENFLILLGLLVGAIRYLPVLIKHNRTKSVGEYL